VTTAEGSTALTTGADAASVAARSGSAVQKIGARIASSFFVLADTLSFANDPLLVGAYDLVTEMSSCAVKAVKKPQARRANRRRLPVVRFRASRPSRRGRRSRRRSAAGRSRKSRSAIWWRRGTASPGRWAGVRCASCSDARRRASFI